MQIILAHPRIPQNAGAVARLAAATRTRLVLARPLGFRVDDAAVRRAGLDYWEEARVEVASSLEAALEDVPGAVYFFSSRAERLYLDARFQADDTLVFGEEAHGLPPEILAAVPPDRQLRIPIFHPNVRSLNLATAVAIALYEALRQIGGLEA